MEGAAALLNLQTSADGASRALLPQLQALAHAARLPPAIGTLAEFHLRSGDAPRLFDLMRSLPDLLSGHPLTDALARRAAALALERQPPASSRAGDTGSSTSSTPVGFLTIGPLWPWDGRSLEEQGGGGSEEMVASLAAALANGRSVGVYGAAPRTTLHRGVSWRPLSSWWRAAEEGAALIVPRQPTWAREAGPLPGIRRVLWLTEPHYPTLNDAVAADWDDVVVVSDWHKAAMTARHGVLPRRMTVIPNGLEPDHFREPAPRERNVFVWASSPDRGLLRLLRIWPRIRTALPHATLEIYNSWRAMEVLARHNPGWRRFHRSLRLQYDEAREQPGVIVRGMVAPSELARAFCRASAWLYPTHVEETFCITAIKARAGGCVPVTTALGALPQTAEGGFLVPPPTETEEEAFDEC